MPWYGAIASAAAFACRELLSGASPGKCAPGVERKHNWLAVLVPSGQSVTARLRCSKADWRWRRGDRHLEATAHGSERMGRAVPLGQRPDRAPDDAHFART